jgi:glycosyltransferase involved in cell wall biosynthesis
MDEVISLSVVTPVYRGAEYLPALVAELAAVRDGLVAAGHPVRLVEAVFVDDGAVDHSAAVLEELQAKHHWVRVLTLSRNYGQHPATVAGILHTGGDWVATLDEDLQHPPAELFGLLTKAVREQYDLVYARPERGPHGKWYRDLSSRWVKAVVGRLSGNPHVGAFNSFRMIRGSVARAAAAVSTGKTFLDIALGWFTQRVGVVHLQLTDRRFQKEGKSGYSLWALVRHAGRLLLSSEVKVLRAGVILGVFALLLSVALTVGVLVLKLVSPQTIVEPGWASLILAVTFFGGLSVFLSGVAVEYAGRVSNHILGRPTFFVVDRSKDRILREHLARPTTTQEAA